MGSDNGPRRHGRAGRRIRRLICLALLGALVLVAWVFFGKHGDGAPRDGGDSPPNQGGRKLIAGGPATAGRISGGVIGGGRHGDGKADDETLGSELLGGGGAADEQEEEEEPPPVEEEDHTRGRPHDPCDFLEDWKEKFHQPAAGEGELWWGGIVQRGMEMPYRRPMWHINLAETWYNQANPVMVSNRGRYLWSDAGRRIQALDDGSLCVEGSERGYTLGGSHRGDGDLRGAVTAASSAHFPSTGRIPDPLLFSAPQYNLWIECMYSPTQQKVLEYAQKVVDHGLPPGVIMIDTNWSEFYGSLRFHRERFPDPEAMLKQLHELGFKVMVWVVPFVSPDTTVFREARARNLLVKNSWGGVGVPEWWDGHSALWDFLNPDAVEYFQGQLKMLRKMGVDGFKFDGGDPDYYKQLGGEPEKNANLHCQAFAQLGLEYNMSEYRACWKMAGTHLAQRLADKSHTWDHKGLAALLPNGLAMGLMGYAYTAPDMIGGGQYMDFVEVGTLRPKDGFELDRELFVRYAQASALFPMMQFSLAPWRVLDAPHLEMVVEAARLHLRHTDYILKLARESSHTGEPILRHMEYVFPGNGYEGVVDQFLLGDQVLVAPILAKGKNTRNVVIPPGKWAGRDGAREEGVVEGPTNLMVEGEGEEGAPYCSLMWFQRQVDGAPPEVPHGRPVVGGATASKKAAPPLDPEAHADLEELIVPGEQEEEAIVAAEEIAEMGEMNAGV